MEDSDKRNIQDGDLGGFGESKVTPPDKYEKPTDSDVPGIDSVTTTKSESPPVPDAGPANKPPSLAKDGDR